MFIFKLRAVACNQTYLQGLTLCLNDMLNNNPGWSYRLLCHDDPAHEISHLTVLDFTMYESLHQMMVQEDEYALLVKEKGYRLLLLVHADQQMLIDQLVGDFTCSLLSIDEHIFQFRDIVEASLRKRRYISSSIVQTRQRLRPEAEHINFTRAETTVLEYIKKGKSGIQIAQLLFRSQKTISSHKRNIMKKLGVTDDFHLKAKISECHI